MDVEFHIEELVLRGIDPAARYRVADALAEELRRLVQERGIPQWMSSGERSFDVDGGTLVVTPDAPPQHIGAQIAQAIYGGKQL